MLGETINHSLMDDLSVLKIFEDASNLIDNSTDEELKSYIDNDSLTHQWEKIKKWQTLVKKAEISTNEKKDDVLKLLNLVQFIRISILDLTTIFIQFIQEDIGEIQKKLLFRTSAMMIYEFIEDIPELLGKEMRDSINKLTNNDKDIIVDLNKIQKEISKLKQEEYTLFVKNVRVISIAHKDHDSQKLFYIIESISDKEIIVLITYIFAWHKLFETFIETLTKKITLE
jgi:hypothetical protein